MPDMHTNIYEYARDRLGTKVGNGQCWTLANNALVHAGARPPAQASLYVWGTEVPLGQLARGNIIQFTRYTVRIEQADGSWQELTRGDANSPRHTAIVETVRPNGEVVVLEANVDASQNVRRNTLYFQAGTVGTATITITGDFTFYQAQAASSN